jgi:hypothetical protein
VGKARSWTDFGPIEVEIAVDDRLGSRERVPIPGLDSLAAASDAGVLGRLVPQRRSYPAAKEAF